MRLIAFAAAAALALGGEARAQSAGGMTIEEVAAAFKENGFGAETGDGVIYSATNGFNFALYAYNCGSGGRCNEFLFGVSFEISAPVELATINAFNEGTLAGRGYLDADGDPNLEHLFTVANGDDKEIVERNLAIWDSIILEFAKAIGYFGAATS